MASIFINITREKLYKKYHMEGFTMQRFTLPRDLYHGKGAPTFWKIRLPEMTAI